MRSLSGRRPALVRIELLLDHSLRPGLLAGWLVLGLELLAAGFTDSNDRNVLHSLYDSKIGLGHGTQSPTISVKKVFFATFAESLCVLCG